MKKRKKLLRLVFGRTTFVVLFLLIQVGILLMGFAWLEEYMLYFYGASVILSAVTLIYIISADESTSIKLSWVVPILVFPVFGTLFYLFVRLQIGTKLIGHRLKMTSAETAPYLKQDTETAERFNEMSSSQGNLVRYMNRFAGCPVYQNTAAQYFPLGDDMFVEMKRRLKAAKHFIFMEYFIVERGEMWNSILEILEEKVREGVEVRVMYDGMCCLMLLPYSYPKTLREKGIKCKMFSPIRPALSTHQNNRDHRKICVIDGHTAFTGGVNLADEYINRKVRFGHWKDTAVMVEGDAAVGFTMMFLQMWGVTEQEKERYESYLKPADYRLPKDADASGFVIPYGDSPLDKENVGEQVYLDILGHAKKYVHIMTPYLILDDQMINALQYSAKRGVETIIIMPHIPDKKSAFMLAHSYYTELIEAGVKIYEYLPGFVHSKTFVSDGEKAVVGSVNMDFRSQYLNFECGVYIYENPVVEQIKKDFDETLPKCVRMTKESVEALPALHKFCGKAMRLIAPLM